MNPNFEPTAGDADFRTLKRFLPYLWPVGRPDLKLRVAVALFLVLVAKATLLIMPFAYKGVIDRMAGASQGSDAVWVIVALVWAYAAGRFGAVLFDNLRNAIFERVGQEATRQLSLQVFAHIHRLSLRFHLERKTGALARTIERGTKSVDNMLYLLLFNTFPVAIELIAVCVIFGTQLGMEYVLATLVMVVAYVWYTWKITSWRNAIRRQAVEYDTKAIGQAVDSLLNYETVKYFNAEAAEQRRYDRAYTRYSDAAVKNETSLAWLNIGQSVITNLMMGAAMAWTVIGWSEGRLTPGDVVLVNTLLAQLFRPLDILGMVYREVKQGLIDMEAMFKLLDTSPEIIDAPGAPALVVSGGAVSFRDVHFAYETRRPILKGISFEVPAGSRTAIVGPSGAGKSTLARILYRFYAIQQGEVRIDGQDISAVTQDSLRAAIGIVPQDTVLFNDSIGYNIGYGREGASQRAIEGAAAQAQIHDFVLHLPDGYETTVGERGLKLSGGEKQRVAIARTILKDPRLLILDEATSALDSATEADIQDALAAVEQGRTTLIIAHRLSTIADADQILVMRDGQIAERGTHADLLAADGLYAELWNLQASEDASSENA